MNHIRSKVGDGLCTEPGFTHQGRNSGYQAIGLAYHFGVSRIVLLGYDMQYCPDSGRRHWFGDHPKGLTNAEGIGTWVPRFTPLARDLEAEGIEVINATPTTALQCFKRARLEDIPA